MSNRGHRFRLRKPFGFAQQKRPSWPSEPSEVVMHSVCVICGKRGLVYKKNKVCYNRKQSCINIEQKEVEERIHGKGNTPAQ